MCAETFDFRLRGDVAGGRRLQVDEDHLVLHEDRTTVVLMRPARGGPSIKEADALSIWGTAYETTEAAEAAGRLWKHRVSRAFAAVHIGVDFGNDRASGGMSDLARLNVLERTGQHVLNDVHGLMTFPTNLKPRFISGSGSLSIGVPVARFEAALSSRSNIPLSDDEELALAVYAHAQALRGSAEAKLIAMMMALEVFIDPRPREPSVRHLVDDLKRAVEAAQISSADRDSLLGALERMKSESITGAGRRVVSALDQRTYGGKSADQFFVECYNVRSALVHGNKRRPAHDQVARLVGHLSHLLGDLIAGRRLVDELE